jgi:tRNA nucleotidyltransferase (CCA-adding enzyme)
MKRETIERLLLQGTDEDFRRTAELSLDIARAVKEAGGRALMVGGITRDLMRREWDPNVELKDIDLEVFGLEKEILRDLLSRFDRVLEVGMSFAVFKLAGLDVSIPRRDNKVSEGHKGFIINTDPNMPYEEAARRRSFTINSMGLDPLTGELLDPYGGEKDLQERILRAVNPTTFVEDSLRVLRGMQFVGRFRLTIDPETLRLCRSIPLKDLSEERIGEEWQKLLFLAGKPSAGLQAAYDMGVLEKLHPELYSMIGVHQEEDWHPEGDVWQHTKLTVDAMAGIVRREELDGEDREILMLAALLHDIGKPETTEIVNDRIHSYNHDNAGLEPAKAFMENIKRGKKVIDAVLPLIKYHLFLVYNPDPSDRSIRRLSYKLQPATIRQLAFVIEADMIGMMADDGRIGKCRRLLRKAEALELAEAMPEPLLMGRILLKEGYEPGPRMGDILDAAYEAQLNEEFDTPESALEWVKERYKI